MPGPLAGLRVIDAGMNVAGPAAASTLAGLGAEVIKLEPPSGDTTRQYRPVVEDASAIFATVNHNKRLISVDLRTDAGREVLAALATASDVLVENLRPGTAAKLGLDAASCHAANPRLVHGSVEAFHPGSGGRPGYDLLVQAESGIMDLTGPADGDPVRLPGTMVDQVTGLWLAHGLLAELHGTRDHAAVRVAMIDVALWLLAEKVSSFLATGDPPHRAGSGTSVTTPHGAYRAADGVLVIGAASDALFARLAEVVGPPVFGDVRFLDQEGRLRLRAELDEALHARLATATADEWCARLTAVGVPVGKVRSLPEALAVHDRDSATGLGRSTREPAFGVLAPPVRGGGPAWRLKSATGPVGRDTRSVLSDLGYSAERVDGLVRSGAVRAADE